MARALRSAVLGMFLSVGALLPATPAFAAGPNEEPLTAARFAIMSLKANTSSCRWQWFDANGTA